MREVFYALTATAAFVASPSLAQTDTDALSVTATVNATCGITSTTALAFGAVTQSATDIDSSGTVELICTSSTPWFLSAATGANPTGAQNRMKHSLLSEYLNYDIYADTGRITPFPIVAGTLGSGDTGGIGTGLAQSVTVFGRIPAGQAVPTPGSYADTVTMTVTY